ncbi:tetratricopeptide repeat-containing response regulator [Parathalassolituus penaei]|uniref:Response regulator n=1 Tax=Parathalassolituus penaei TaxID=2997323 RepID=A0A9X3EEK8_9GAMM|nr:tetratricopeptide repeat-containing response regulator [Parathalassolituus penaei]MCY0965275.1 response regulator [Parathalassolituus penaei]
MPPSKPSLDNLRLLVIDDMVEARSSIKRMATELGAKRIDTAMDGDQATELIRNNDYDLILSDYNLGKGRDGQQVLEEARYSGRLRYDSVFVMITGENAADMVMGALEYEPDAYLTKPITMGMLGQRLWRIFEIRRQLSPLYQAMNRRQQDKAIELANSLLLEMPRMLGPITRILGPLYMHKEEYNNAIRVYSSLLNEHKVSWARLGQAICLHHLGDSLSAIALLKDILRSHPRYVQCYDWMARIYLSMGDADYALQLLQKAASISPKAVLRQSELGQLADRQQNWEVAANAWEQVVRLGRHSCYKNAESYFRFADAANQLIESDRVTYKRLSDKVARALNEVLNDFSQQPAIQLRSWLAQGRLFKSCAQPDKARHALLMAEQLYHKMEHPAAGDTIALSAALVQSGNHVKAKELLQAMEAIDERDQLMQELDEAVIRQHSDETNARGVSLYEAGDLFAAMRAFDDAISHQEAGISVLLNAIQVRVSIAQGKQCDPQLRQSLIVQCRPLFQRIGAIASTDERYDRYHRLRASFTRLLQEAAQ